jgi:chromosome segregation and condensation protein ScpB
VLVVLPHAAPIFATAEPVIHAMVACVADRSRNLDALVDDIRDELRDRPYEPVVVAGGWSFRILDKHRRASGDSASE